MKKQILSIIIVLSLIFSCSSNIVIKDDGLVYKKDELFNGEYKKIYYRSGKAFTGCDTITAIKNDEVLLTFITNYQNGKKHGYSAVYGKDGEYMLEQTFSRGQLRKQTDYYDNGQKQKEGYYKDGDLDSLWISWWENGQIEQKGLYKYGKENGLWTYWHKNGIKAGEGIFREGKEEGLVTFWYENGQKEREGVFKEGKPDGLYTIWYENGQKKQEVNMINGYANGLLIRWWENGNKQMEGEMNNDKKIGKWIYYNENGTVKEEDN